MWLVFAFAGVTVFLFGLFQWARTGANLWQIFRIKKATQTGRFSMEQYRKAARRVEQLERSANRSLSASVKLLGTLAIAVWLFLGASIVLEMFGVDLIGELSSRATVYWTTVRGSQPFAPAPSNSPLVPTITTPSASTKPPKGAQSTTSTGTSREDIIKALSGKN